MAQEYDTSEHSVIISGNRINRSAELYMSNEKHALACLLYRFEWQEKYTLFKR